MKETIVCTRVEFKLSARHSDDNGVESLMKCLLAFLEERKRGGSKNKLRKCTATSGAGSASFWFVFSLGEFHIRKSTDLHAMKT